MRREESFAGRFLLLSSSNLLLQCLGFIYRILLSRFAGTEGLGVYRLASSVYTILHATCLSGITMTCTRVSAAWKAEGKSGAINALVRFSFGLFGGLFLLAASATWFGREFIGSVLIGDHRIISAIPIMLGCLLLTGVENIFKSTMVGLNRIDNAVVSELTEQIVRILAVVVLLAEFSNDDLGRTAVLIFSASVVSEVVSAAIMTIMYLRMIKPKQIRPPTGYQTSIACTALPVSIAALCSNLISSAGAVLLPKRLTLSGLSYSESVSVLGAVSGVAAPIMTLPMAIILSLCTATMPEISARCSRMTPERVQLFSEKVLRSVGLISVPFTALLVPLAPVISRLFFYHAVDENVFFLIGCSCIFSYYQMISGCMLNGSGHQGWNAATSTVGEVLQLVLFWILAAKPYLRIYGYILAQCIAPILVAFVNFLFLERMGIVRNGVWRKLTEPIACGMLLYLWTRIFFTGFSGHFDQWAALVLTLIASSTLYLILLRLLKVDLRCYLTNPIHQRTFQPMFY